MSFRLVPKLVTLNDLEGSNGRYFALFQRIPVASWWVLVLCCVVSNGQWNVVRRLHVARSSTEREVYGCHPLVQRTHLSAGIRRGSLLVRMV